MSVGAIGGSSLPPLGLSSTPSPPATATVSPYQSAYDALLQQDAAELLQLSLGSATAAASNVSNVLAQAAALQQEQLAAQQQAQAAPPPPIAEPAVPTLASVIQQSNASASSDLSNGTLGASIDTLA
jgi:hypothetical protein